VVDNNTQGVDANLLMASNNISRFHMHQGTNYRYQAWQPISTNRTSIGTKVPYYGNIAVAAFLGDLTNASRRPQVVNINLEDGYKAAYASYIKGELATSTLFLPLRVASKASLSKFLRNTKAG
jgi:hypothetical protein